MDERQRGLVRELRWGGSLLLVLLGALTLGVYLGVYVWRQTRAMNRHLDPGERLWLVLPAAVGLLCLAGAALLAAGLLAGSEDLAVAERCASQAALILALLWALRARRRMNEFLDAGPGDDEWFGWVPTFFFGALYFNVKVNRLNRLVAEQAPPGGWPEVPRPREER